MLPVGIPNLIKMIRSILAVDQQKLDSLQDAPKLTL